MLDWALLAIVLAPAAAPADEVQRIELAGGYCLLARPDGLPPDTPVPLVVCLHGTDTGAEDILRFWRSVPAELPFAYLAPQGSRAGWRESDLPLLRDMLDHLNRDVAFDPLRVLLTGHSAGGAMAFRLLYVEAFPATAVAVTANYLPPNITAEAARARQEVPVFYAVGIDDLNHNRMRAGAALLREAGVPLTMRRPRIGHVLDADVGREALAWFEQICRDRIRALINQAQDYREGEPAPGPLAAGLETVLRYSETHFADQITPVREALAGLEAPGRSRLTEARNLERRRRYGDAHALYLRVERDYCPASLEGVARAGRQRLEQNPLAASVLDMERP